MSQKFAIGLVHGAHHNAACWQRVVPELRRQGHTAVPIELPIDRPNVTQDTYAIHIAKTMARFDNVVLLGHSRGAKAIARVPGLIAVRQLVYVNGTVDPSADQLSIKDTLPPALTEQYAAGRQFVPGSPFSVYDKAAAGIFYTDTNIDQPTAGFIKRLIPQLRPQNRQDMSPPLAEQPDVRTAAIVSTEDEVVNPDYAREVARKYLGVKALEMAGGHSPFVTRPIEFTNVLLDSLVDR